MRSGEGRQFYLDMARCIGCQACVQACRECDTHRGQSMIQLDQLDRGSSPQTVPVVCMHCDSPTCAEVCPADAIKRTEDGVVQTARKPRCISCNNCVLACPFGVPKMDTGAGLMMKCDMCYDRTSVDLKPMCASVCPSQALAFETPARMAELRPNAKPLNTFQFGAQTITTKVSVLVPENLPEGRIDVVDAMFDPGVGHDPFEDLPEAAAEATPGGPALPV